METLAIAEGLVDGVKAVPPTLWHGIERVVEFYSSPEEKEKIQGQNYRAYLALGELVRYGLHGVHSPLTKLIAIILYHYYESLPNGEKEKIRESASKKTAYMGSKIYTSGELSAFIARRIAKQMVKGSAAAWFSKVAIRGSFTELSLLGLLEKAGDASDRLKALFPRIWRDLMLKDLDMLYFIVEHPMKKYLDAIRRKRWNLS
jgi:hypothetical protein